MYSTPKWRIFLIALLFGIGGVHAEDFGGAKDPLEVYSPHSNSAGELPKIRR